MAYVAYVMSVFAYRLAILFFVTDGTLHMLIIFYICQRRTAYKAFVFHAEILFPISLLGYDLARVVKDSSELHDVRVSKLHKLL